MTEFSIGFVAIARPTFDVALAQEKTDAVYAQLARMFHIQGDTTLVMDTESLQSAIAQLQRNTLDCIVMLQASFADSSMAQALAQAITAPLLLWAVPEALVGGRLRLNSFCGINLAGHSLRRAGFQYEYVYADPDDETALQKVHTLALAGHVKRELAAARIARIGQNPDGFETCLFDADNLKTQLGVEVVQIDLQQFFEKSKQANPTAVANAQQAVSQDIAGLDALNPTEVTGTLNTYVALDELGSEENLHGFAVRCWPEFFTELGCSACGAMSMMTNDLRPCSCEADVNGTITQLMLQLISGEAAFGTDMVAFDVEQDTAVVWHCGLAPLSMADPDFVPEATVHSNRQKALLMQFPLKAGRITVARLSEASGELRLVIGTGEMLQAPPAFTGTSGTVRFDSGTSTVMDIILNEGLEHHIALTYGDYSDALTSLAKLLDLPVLRL